MVTAKAHFIKHYEKKSEEYGITKEHDNFLVT